jgi:Uma2 family endonuclease
MTALPRGDRPSFASVEAFLAYEFADDRPRDLIDGIVVAHAAPSPEHARIVANLGRAIGNALEAAGSPCFVEVGSGIVPRRRRKPTYRVPDLLIRCPESDPGGEAVVVVEVISPANTASEMDEKARDYKSVPSIRQIIHLAQDRLACSFQRKAGDLWIAEQIDGADAVLPIDGFAIRIPLAVVYRHVAIADDAADAAGSGAPS